MDVRSLGRRDKSPDVGLGEPSDSGFGQYPGRQDEHQAKTYPQRKFHPVESAVGGRTRSVTAEGTLVQGVQNTDVAHDIAHDHLLQPVLE